MEKIKMNDNKILSKEVYPNAKNKKIILQYCKLSDNAFSPFRATEKSAGYDLKSAYNYIVLARSKEMIKTDLSIRLPENCYGRIAPRSGIAWKHFISVAAGVIDQDFTGNVTILLFNHSKKDYIINRGDRIAQLICERIYLPDLEEVSDLIVTQRGSKGFGSTGNT